MNPIRGKPLSPPWGSRGGSGVREGGWRRGAGELADRRAIGLKPAHFVRLCAAGCRGARNGGCQWGLAC